MMSFGWRPQSSCYKGVSQTGTCPDANWFYLLLAAAIAGGLMSRKRGGGA
jgi:hypothetical protein